MTATISLDIKGAFDRAEWSVTLTNLREALVPQYLYHCIHSYFTDRKVVYEGM